MKFMIIQIIRMYFYHSGAIYGYKENLINKEDNIKMFKFRDKKELIGIFLGAICFLPSFLIVLILNGWQHSILEYCDINYNSVCMANVNRIMFMELRVRK